MHTSTILSTCMCVCIFFLSLLVPACTCRVTRVTSTRPRLSHRYSSGSREARGKMRQVVVRDPGILGRGIESRGTNRPWAIHVYVSRRILYIYLYRYGIYMYITLYTPFLLVSIQINTIFVFIHINLNYTSVWIYIYIHHTCRYILLSLSLLFFSHWRE